MKATLNLTANGGSVNLMLRASDNAIAGTSAQGSFYTAEIQNPVVTATSCTATLLQRKYVNSVWTNLSVTAVACRPQMEVRAVMFSTGQMMVFFDNYFQQTVTDTEIASGRPGIGGYGMPVGNSVTKIEMGPIDHVAPFGVDVSTVGTSASSNYIDLQWRGASDDANGIGVWRYYVLRGGTIIGESSSAEFTDSAVTASTSYSYSFRACDYHKNCAADSVVGTVTSAPTGAVDPRQIGIRPTGAYWGGGGEQIDMRSGNMNYSIPMLKAQGRGGWGVTFALSYNSQLWRQDQGKVWKLGADIGYGFGWRLQAGSLVPVYNGLWSLDHYIFIDSTGAEYRLNVNNAGVWSCGCSLYLSYDSASRRLYFRDGSFWQMDARSAGFEDDMGTVYPTVMEDTNGNQIIVRYDTGINAAWTNSSARITQIEDVRGNGAATYNFSYTYPVAGRPHFAGVSSTVSPSENWGLDYYTEQPLADPFTGSAVWGSTAFPFHLTGVGGTYTFEWANLTGEMSKVNYPAGGYLRWTYLTSSFTSPSNPSGPPRNVREVNYRYMNNNTGEHAYYIERDPGDSALGRFVHSKARMHDVDAGGGTTDTDKVKVYVFNYDPAVWNIGLMNQYDEKVSGQATAQLEKLFTWTQDALGNADISSVKSASDQNNTPATQQRTDQVVDTHGNVTSTVIYDWGNSITPLRTFTNTYLTGANYSSRYIFNRLVSSTVSNGGTPLTLVTNTYDGYAGLAVPSPIYEHDTANYGTSFLYRGNVTTSARPGVTTTMGYDATGTVLTMAQNGKTVSVTSDSSKNFAVPSLITANGFNTSFSWTAALNPNSQTGPNADVVTYNYDSSARPSRTYSPYGAYTDYTYSFVGTPPLSVTATTSGRWVKTTVDGFGRTVKAETGDGSGTKSVVDTEYAPCACSPMGKMKRVSQPHVVGGTVYWTTYTYDARGRTLSVVAADGASTTTYVYSVTNDSVTVTDAAGKTKTMTMDALGNLTQVVEPNPAGGTFTTNYTYDLMNRLTGVSMPRGAATQTRSWNYDATTQRLTSLTNPENGTVSFTYNAADGTVATKTDAKGQQTQYSYDAKKRVTQITKAGDSCQTVTFGYDTNALLAGFSFNTSDRLATMSYFAKQPIGCEAVTEMYSYTPAGGKRQANPS